VRALKEFPRPGDYGLVTRPDFDDIEREFGPMIRRIAAAHEANQALAEELVQDIWLELWRALPSFRGASSLKTFVARVASYRAITHVRRSARVPRPAELPDTVPASDPSPEHHTIHQDRQAKLVSAVRDLSLPLRQVTLLTLEGLTPQEISSVLGITANAVAIRLSRAKQILRNTLGDKQ
jgi:RNA polymerase sigma-70 factor (ECF subfamily)